MSTLNYTVVDSSESALHKTSVLITGETSATVIDAGFTRAEGHRIVAEVLDSGKTLKTVIITAGDPDFYFGAEVIQNAFPDVQFFAPADVIEHIQHSYEGKLVAWAHLGANLPSRLVPIAILGKSFEVDGTTIEVHQANKNLGDRSYYLWEPLSSSLFGGVLLFGELHVWTADTATAELRSEWIEVLNQLLTLNPSFVVAGHRKPQSATDISSITQTRDYLLRFENILTTSGDAASTEKALLELFPEYGLEISASLGSKVAKGEMPWG
ncbi:MAG: MBL fold metallo-hydrolase [Mycobacteriaceae bacterium]